MGDAEVGLTDGMAVGMVVGTMVVGVLVGDVVGWAVGGKDGWLLKNFNVAAPLPITPPC